MSINRANEELLALWFWLQSFPRISSASIRNGVDPEKQPHVVVDVIRRCLDNDRIARAVLSTAKEIICDTSTTNTDGLLETNNAIQIWKEIFKMFHLETGSSQMLDSDADWRCPVLRSMLCCAVSEECSKREEYIPRILALNTPPNDSVSQDGSLNVQQILMKIISRGMDIETPDASKKDDQVSKKSISRSNSSDDVIKSFCEADARQSIKSMHDYDDAEVDDAITSSDWRIQSDHTVVKLEQELKLAKEENDLLNKASIYAKQRESDIYFELETFKSNYRSRTLQEEAAYLDRERIFKEQYDNEISQLRNQLEQSIQKCEEGGRAKLELSSLKDDVDILRHSETKLLYTEDQLRKCKEKLQEFSIIKAQLLQEEEAHGKAVEQALLLENELNQLQPLKRQLETYRVRATDAEVKLAQCQHDLEKLQHLSRHLALENTELTTTSKIRFTETEQIRQKTKILSSEDCSFNSLGEGLSELNPALKEEILRLRSDNQRLNAFVSKRTDDAVVKLEEKLEDAERLAESFKIRYLHVLTELETMQDELQHTLGIVSKLEAEVVESTQRTGDLGELLSDERARNLEAQRAAEERFDRETHDLLEKAASDLAEKESLWSDLLESERIDSQNALDAVFHKLQKTIDQYNEELTQLREGSRLLIEAEKHGSSTRLEQLALDQASAMEFLRQETAREREELINKGKSMLASKQEKAKAIFSTLQEEHAAEMSRMKALYADFCEKQQAYEEKAKQKISSYKTKLDVANGKISFLESETENLHSQQQRIEREKEKMKEEAERLRRQVGTRMGAESDFGPSFEKLRQEYSLMLEEHRIMKRQLSMAEFNNVTANVSGSGGNMQYSIPTAGSTISQLRHEYEDTIQLLNDEKRELVMKNSATISDLQRIEQRSWQLEEEKFKLKEELTSANLKIQRLTHNYEKQALFTSTYPEASRPILQTLENMVDNVSSIAPIKQRTEVATRTTAENDENVGVVLASHPVKRAKTAPSLIVHTQARPRGVNEPPECKQS